MIHHIVQFALRQRFLILMLAVLVLVAGALSFQQMPVDAYPDLSPPLVEVITQWPGHAAEEIERVVPLIERLAARPGVLVSIDTYKPLVADAAITFPIEIIARLTA